MGRLFAQYVSEDEAGYIDELYMTTGEIIDLRRRGHTIAGHSISHPSLPQLDEADQEREIGAAKGWLELCSTSRSPGGTTPTATTTSGRSASAERLGIEIAYSTRPPIDWVSLDDRFRVPRVDTVFLPTSRGRRAGRAPRRGRVMPEPVVVPKLNENDDEVVVVSLTEGAVSRGQVLFEVETSKAVQEVEAEADGFPRWAPRSATTSRCSRRSAGSSRPKPNEMRGRSLESSETWVSETRARPATEPARRLAAELGVSLDDVPGTGIVRESDVRALPSPSL